MLVRPQSRRLVGGVARWLAANAELGLGLERPSPGHRTFQTFQTFRDYLERRPGVTKLQRTLGEEAMMNMPVPHSHEVLRAGRFAYVVEGVTNNVYRVPVSHDDVDPEPDLILRTEEVRPGAHVAGIRRSRCGAQLSHHARQGWPLARLSVGGGCGRCSVSGPRGEGRWGSNWGAERKGRSSTLWQMGWGGPSTVMMTSLVGAKEATGVPETSVVFGDDNPAHFVGLQRSKDWSHVIINSVARTSSEAFVLDESGGTTKTVRSRRTSVVYAVEHVNGQLVMMSDEGGENALYLKTQEGDEWRLVYAPADGSTIHRRHVRQHACHQPYWSVARRLACRWCECSPCQRLRRT